MAMKHFFGVIPPMVTPLLDNKRLDSAGLERLIEHILGGGVHGVFILGTTGEATNINYCLRHELVRYVCRQVAGRVPVLVGITDTTFDESVRLSWTAAEAGAAAVVAAPPYYFTPGQPELIEYYTRLTMVLPLPLFIYNMPIHTKVMIEPSTVLSLAQIPKVAGLKDSSSNIVYFNTIRHLLCAHSDFSIMVGSEEALGEVVLMGGHGGICGGANIFPKLYVGIYNAAVEGNVAQVRQLQEYVMAVGRSLYGVGQHVSSMIKGVKCALSLMDICSDVMSLPFNCFRNEERTIIHERLAALRDRLDGLSAINC